MEPVEFVMTIPKACSPVIIAIGCLQNRANTLVPLTTLSSHLAPTYFVM